MILINNFIEKSKDTRSFVRNKHQNNILYLNYKLGCLINI
jgi:hypothetical protein